MADSPPKQCPDRAEGEGRRSLAELSPGQAGTVLALPPERAGSLGRLGLVPGTRVECLHRSPLGDPSAYRFRDTTLALRRSDTARILVSCQRKGASPCPTASSSPGTPTWANPRSSTP